MTNGSLEKAGAGVRVKLKKDILIPAGTILDDAPRTLAMCRGHVEAIIGLTDDSSGTMLYFVDPDDPALDEWFEVLDMKGNAMPCGDLGRDWVRRSLYGDV